MKRPLLPVIKSPNSGLSPEDKAKLRDLEEKILKSTMDVCVHLAEIKGYKNGIFWNDRYDSFADYVRDRFQYQTQHAYRLAAAGEFVLLLEASAKTLPLPSNEIQVRHIINKIPEKKRVECWEKITKKFQREEWTGDVIEAAVVAFRNTIPEEELIPARQLKKKPVLSEIRKKSHVQINRLKATVAPLPNANDILVHITKLEKLIEP